MNEMKKILLIGTGGTIASDVTDSGLAPELTTEQLLSHIPGISDICGVDCLQLLNLDSTNMTPAHWLEVPAWIRGHHGLERTTTAAMTALSSPTARTPWRIRRRP